MGVKYFFSADDDIDEVDVDIKDCWIAYNAENAEGWGNAFCFYQPNKNAPSLDELKNRLIKRDTESKEVIEKRIEQAKWELRQKDSYQYVIVNKPGLQEEASKELSNILLKELA